MHKLTFEIPFNYAIGILHDETTAKELIAIVHKIFKDDINEYLHFLELYKNNDLFGGSATVNYIVREVDEYKIGDIMCLRPRDKLSRKDAAFIAFVCGMFRHFSTPKE